MRIQILSDLHIEMVSYQPEVLPVDLVVLAGDVHTDGRAIQWAAETFGCRVLYVAGNHDYYGGHLDKTMRKMREAAAATNGQVTLLERESIVIDGVRFLGATAWTDFSLFGNRVFSGQHAEASMSDYKAIRATSRFRRLRAADTASICDETKIWLRNELEKPFTGKTVVITHHAPCPLSIPEWRRISNDELNPAYANDWANENFWKPEKIDLWVHGHIHNAVDYVEKGVRVVCNPRGYGNALSGQWLVNGFDPWKTIEL